MYDFKASFIKFRVKAGNFTPTLTKESELQRPGKNKTGLGTPSGKYRNCLSHSPSLCVSFETTIFFRSCIVVLRRTAIIYKGSRGTILSLHMVGIQPNCVYDSRSITSGVHWVYVIWNRNLQASSELQICIRKRSLSLSLLFHTMTI